MKLKEKLLCAALAATFAAPAAATIKWQFNLGESDGGGELFLTLIDRDPTPGDGDDSRSYTRDLGIALNQFLPAPAGQGVTTPGHSIMFAADPLLESFLSGTDPARRANLVWNIGAIDNNQAHRYLTTAKDITADQRPTNAELRAFDNNTPTFLSEVNTKGTHPGGDAVNGSSISGVADGAAYGGSANWGNRWAGAAEFDTTALIGESTNFYLLAATASGISAPTTLANLDLFDNEFGNATWTLGQDGSLIYMAPVPEPGEWALMLAGLAAVGWVARRRKTV